MSVTESLMSPQEGFSALAERLRNGKSPDEIYHAVAETALSVVEGCDHAGIGILDGDRFRTAAATDDVVRHVDRLQDEVGEGPCLDASAEESWKLDNDITTHSQWPRLAPLVVAHTPVRSTLAFPLVHNGRRGGALNLFADRAGAFDDRSTETAAILASFASVAIVAAEHQQRADELQEGLETNREIGKAIGLLMATHQISSDEAFEILRSASQRLNRKLRDIAAGIVGNQPNSSR